MRERARENMPLWKGEPPSSSISRCLNESSPFPSTNSAGQSACKRAEPRTIFFLRSNKTGNMRAFKHRTKSKRNERKDVCCRNAFCKQIPRINSRLPRLSNPIVYTNMSASVSSIHRKLASAKTHRRSLRTQSTFWTRGLISFVGGLTRSFEVIRPQIWRRRT